MNKPALSDTFPEMIKLRKAYQEIRINCTQFQKRKMDNLFKDDRFVFQLYAECLRRYRDCLVREKKHLRKRTVQKHLQKMKSTTESLIRQLADVDPVISNLLTTAEIKTPDFIQRTKAKILFPFDYLSTLKGCINDAIEELEKGDHGRRDYSRLMLAMWIKFILKQHEVTPTTYMNGIWHTCYKTVLCVSHNEIGDDAIQKILKEANKMTEINHGSLSFHP